MKHCFKCDTDKPYSDFYKHPKMGDGYLGKCKTCTKLDTLKNRSDNLDYYQAYDRARGSLEHRVEARKVYRHTEAGTIAYRKAHKKYQTENPEIRQAHVAVGNAIRDGKLTPEACTNCGSTEKTEAHHTDYSKPLDVTWLCMKCHKNKHKKNYSTQYSFAFEKSSNAN